MNSLGDRPTESKTSQSPPCRRGAGGEKHRKKEGKRTERETRFTPLELVQEKQTKVLKQEALAHGEKPRSA